MLTNKNVIEAILDRLQYLSFVDTESVLNMLTDELFIESTQLYDLNENRIALIEKIKENECGIENL